MEAISDRITEKAYGGRGCKFIWGILKEKGTVRFQASGGSQIAGGSGIRMIRANAQP